MVIKVTQTHIDYGRSKSGDQCPIAIAIRHSLPKGNKVFVTIEQAIILTRHRCHSVDLPKEAIEFTRKNIGGGEVKPFIFEINYGN